MSVVRVALATARLTRLVTSDWLGEWALVGPVRKWATLHEQSSLDAIRSMVETVVPGNDPIATAWVDEQMDTLNNYDENYPLTWQYKLAKGLDCPFCVGFWIGLAVLIAEAAVARQPAPVRWLWKTVTSALALNQVVGTTLVLLEKATDD